MPVVASAPPFLAIPFPTSGPAPELPERGRSVAGAGLSTHPKCRVARSIDDPLRHEPEPFVEHYGVWVGGHLQSLGAESAEA